MTINSLTPPPPNHPFKRYMQIAASFASVKLGLLIARHPVYVVQTRKQASPHLSNTQLITEIYQTHGIRGFYRSTSVSILKILLSESYRGLLMIEVPSKVQLYLPKDWKKSRPKTYALATSAVAVPIISAADSAILCPVLRMGTLQLTTKEPLGLRSIYHRFIKNHPLRSFYHGYTPLFIQTSILWGNFFVIDDLMKHILEQRFGEVSFSGIALTSLIGGSIQTCVNVIPDTLRVQMQKSSSRHLMLREITKQLIHQHGLRSLFSAIPHRLIGGIITYLYKSTLRNFWTNESSKDRC